MRKRNTGNLLIPLLIGALAFILRFWNILSIGDSYYASFLSDASTYRIWASRLAAGSSFGDPVFAMGPLYPYFLALELQLGIGFFGALVVQALMGASVAVIIYYIARSVFGDKAGIISGLIAAVYAPFIFYDGLILSESIQVFLLGIGLYFLICGPAKLGKFNFLIAGILIGLTALGRATILFFPIGIAFFYFIEYLTRKQKHRTNPWPMIFILFAGVAIGVIPATLHNIANDNMVLISSNTGINFYVGNNNQSSGRYDEPPGLDLSNDFTGRKVAEKESGHALKSSEVSSYWMSKTVADIKADPGHFIGGLFRKAWLYLWYYDISQAESIEIHHEFSPLFSLPLVGFGLVLIFGSIGLLSGKLDTNRWILIILIVSNFIGVVLFFVIGRFRLLGAISLIVASGQGIIFIIHFARVRDWQKILKYAAVAIGIVVVLYLPRPIDRREELASSYDNVGIYYYFLNQPDESIKWYRKAAAVMPDYSACLNNIGTYFYKKGQLDSSAYYFHLSLAVDSAEDKTLMNLGRIAYEKGQLDSAEFYYSWAKRVSPFGTNADDALREVFARRSGTVPPADSPAAYETLFQAAERYASRGQFDQAEKLYLEALKLKKDDVRALNNLGFAYQAQKKYAEAAECFSKVLRLSPENAILYNNLAGTLYQMGKLDSAVVLWERAMRLDPSNQQIKTNLDFVRKFKKD